MDKYIFGMFVIAVVALLQGCAWGLGKDGNIFAFTSSIIVGVAGSILGFQYAVKKTK